MTLASSLRLPTALAVAALALSTACGSSSSAPAPQERVVLGDGAALHLTSVTATGLATVASATIPTAALLDGHHIFAVLKHPTQPWVYALSGNECYSHGAWCWGNARVDRFEVSAGAITWKDAFLYDAAAGAIAPCAAATSTNAGQVGTCVPVDGVFNAAGTRLFVQNDRDDVVDVFSVNATTGALTLLSEGGNTSMHGMALDASGTHLYNGSTVFTVAADAVTDLLTGTDGNDTTLFHPATGPDLLYSTSGDSAVAVYSLADPAAPALVNELAMASSAARSCVSTSATSISRLVVVGYNSIATVGFDGATLTQQNQFDLSGGGTAVEGRGAAVTTDGKTAIAAWFQTDTDAANLSGLKGGADVFSIATDGTLTKLGSYPTARASRAVLALKL